MKVIKNLLNFYVNGNIHVAIAGYCITKISLIEFGLKGRLTPFFVALSIIISYNFIRFMEIKSKRLLWFKEWFENNKWYVLALVLVSIVGLVDVILGTDFNKNAFIILIPFTFITLFYAIPLGKKGNKSLSFRNYPGIKIISIAISWAGITVFFPLYEKQIVFNQTVYIEFIQRFLFLIALTIPFDIRDVNSDDENLKTIPQMFGIKNSKYIGIILLFLFVLLEFLKINFVINYFIAIILTALITGILLFFSSEKQSRFYTGFWVEAVPIFWLIILYILN